MPSTRRHNARTTIPQKVRDLRLGRRWTQAELARRLGLSQSRLSEIERGDGSFTAEQFLSILKLFNVPVSHFTSGRRPTSELQNALARLGAVHLQEDPDVLPSDVDVGELVRKILVAPESPRHITGLAPVVARNIDRISLRRLFHVLVEHGQERRLGWLLENTLVAIRSELSKRLPHVWASAYRRAAVVLDTFFELDLREGAVDRHTPTREILDNDIRSIQSRDEVWASASPISRRWGIVTSLKPEDFQEALRASRVRHS